MLTENYQSSSRNSVKLQDAKLIHRKILYLYTLTTKDQKENLRKTIPLTIASKRIKDLGINLPTEAKDLYPENYKTLMKEIKEDVKRWMERLTMFLDWKNQYCQNDYSVPGNPQTQCNPYQIMNGFFFFAHLDQKILKFVWEHKRPQVGKAILRKKMELEESGPLTSDCTVKL